MTSPFKFGDVISVGPNSDVKWLRYSDERDWTCRYCKACQSRGVLQCTNCGGPKRLDPYPIMIVTNPMETTKDYIQRLTGKW